jgi:hypothetical protein
VPILHQDAHNSPGVYRAGSGIGQADTNIEVSNMQANSAGTQITASVQILPAATLGPRQVRLQTSYGTVMGMATNSPFNVTNPRNLEKDFAKSGAAASHEYAKAYVGFLPHVEGLHEAVAHCGANQCFQGASGDCGH